jgi:rare lipoprotein A (peptidoglycan hydrolase)
MTSPVVLSRGHQLGCERPNYARAAVTAGAVLGALIALAVPAAALESIPKGGGHHKIGSPYEINGRIYRPTDTDDLVETGVASWYGPDFHGKKTANGEIYDMTALTAAHKTMPLPSYAYVTNLQNGRRILVRVNDRGPFVADRLIDLSHGVAQLLGYFDRGLTDVRVEYAGPAPMNGDDSHERQVLVEQAWYQDPSKPGQPNRNAPTVVATSGTYETTASSGPAASVRSTPSPVKAEPVAKIPQALRLADAKPDRAEKDKPVQVARLTAKRTTSDAGVGYRSYDHCWSCADR